MSIPSITNCPNCGAPIDSEPYYFANSNLDISVSIDGTCCPNEKGFFGVMVDEKVADNPNIRHHI